jgi:hypothetical protein
MITTSPTTIDRFTAIATEVIQTLTNTGVLRLLKDAAGTDPLDATSADGQRIIRAMATKIYDGAIKDMNQHLALDQPQPSDPDADLIAKQELDRQWQEQQALLGPKPGPARRTIS